MLPHLPSHTRAASCTQKFRIHGPEYTLTGYVHFTEDPETHDLVEIGISLAKDGTATRAWANAWCGAINLALKHKCPLQEIVNHYKDWKFDPCGTVTGSPHVTSTTSFLDFVVREIEATYLR